MTRHHPARPTKPMVPGAPLPPNLTEVPVLEEDDIRDELDRAQVELLYALGRHRKAWQAMRARSDERDLLRASGTVGAVSAIESDPIWKQRTGDVSWWRDEVTCQATAVLALQAMLGERV